MWGVKMATEMAGDEDGPALAAITHVAWSYGPISTQTNYRRGNFMDKKNLSPSGAPPSKGLHTASMSSFKEGKLTERSASNTCGTYRDGEKEVSVRSYVEVFMLFFLYVQIYGLMSISSFFY